MSGSIPLSLTQQFDKVSQELLIGGKVYTYAAGTTTPQSAYQTAALTLPFSNPITLDVDGRIPYLWFADGTVRVRLTNAAGVLQFDADNMQVSGTSGGGGGVDTTDPDSIATTGDVKWRPSTSPIAGWVRANGRTIGSATSGAAERASADCQALFQFLWNNFVDGICPVGGGRGASAVADWGANKIIGLIDARGRALFGVDDMGNTAAGRINAALIATGSPIIGGSSGGVDRATLVTANLPAYTPTGLVGIADPGHAHDVRCSEIQVQGGSTTAVTDQITAGGASTGANAAVARETGITAEFTGEAQGGTSAPANTMSPFVLGGYFIRL